MNTNTITGYLIDVANEQARPVTIEHSLESFYKVLDCDMIEITPRRIGKENRLYDIICDEEGLLKDTPIISACQSTSLKPVLVGNLLIVNMGDEDVESLKPEDIEYITQYIWLRVVNQFKSVPCLVHCEYA